jgi:hypothetical protein
MKKRNAGLCVSAHHATLDAWAWMEHYPCTWGCGMHSPGPTTVPEITPGSSSADLRPGACCLISTFPQSIPTVCTAYPCAARAHARAINNDNGATNGLAMLPQMTARSLITTAYYKQDNVSGAALLLLRHSSSGHECSNTSFFHHRAQCSPVFAQGVWQVAPLHPRCVWLEVAKAMHIH